MAVGGNFFAASFICCATLPRKPPFLCGATTPGGSCCCIDRACICACWASRCTAGGNGAGRCTGWGLDNGVGGTGVGAVLIGVAAGFFACCDTTCLTLDINPELLFCGMFSNFLTMAIVFSFNRKGLKDCHRRQGYYLAHLQHW